jgi:flagellar motility protein MotE (MotC chaperone)
MTRKAILLRIVFFLAMAGTVNITGVCVYGQEDPAKTIEQKRQELAEKEGRLKKEEERIKAIQKEVEARIQKLNQLLGRIEESLKKLGEVRSERLGHLVKTFEAMPPEEAAVRLVSIERTLAVQIVFKMNSKKAGAILALVDPKKVAELTEGISKNEKKIPTK